jgi:hypothetical protein
VPIVKSSTPRLDSQRIKMSDFAHVFSPNYVAELQYISPASKESVARAGTIVAGWK